VTKTKANSISLEQQQQRKGDKLASPTEVDQLARWPQSHQHNNKWIKTSIGFGLKEGNQLRIQTEANLFSNKASGSKTTPNKASGSRPL